MHWKSILVLLVILLFVAFTGQNWQVVTIYVLNYKFSIQLAFLLISSIIVGYLFALITSLFKQLKLKREIKQLNQKLEKQNEELKSLRYYQIKDDE